MTTVKAAPMICQRCKYTHEGQPCPAPTLEDRNRLLRDMARSHAVPEGFKVRLRWILKSMEGTR